MSSPLLQVRDLRVEFDTGHGIAPAVRGVSLHVEAGELVGLVGESGCGKSVTALSLMRLLPHPPARIVSGEVWFEGRELLRLPERTMRQVRGGRMAMVFQDPFSSLNPTMSLGAQIEEAVRAHSAGTRRQARDRTLELLRAVHMPSPEIRYRQYPHQVSGGQRQRCMIAMGLAAEPALIIADEPTTALDVTVQAQIMSLLLDIRERTNAGILLITHDMAIVAEMCDRVLVMYAGVVVEQGPTDVVLRQPMHPYTTALLESLPEMNTGTAKRLKSIGGQPPNPGDLPAGCAFAPRCPRVFEPCHAREPALAAVAPNHAARCYLAGAPPEERT